MIVDSLNLETEPSAIIAAQLLYIGRARTTEEIMRVAIFCS